MRDIMKKMKVWERNLTYERYVVHINENLSCYAVKSEAEKDFEFGIYDVPLTYWKHCEEIEEAEYRSFKPGEMPMDFIDRPFRSKNRSSHFIDKPTRFDTLKTTIQIMIKERWFSHEVLYHDYEVYINGEWVPVGVKL